MTLISDKRKRLYKNCKERINTYNIFVQGTQRSLFHIKKENGKKVVKEKLIYTIYLYRRFRDTYFI